jgi:isopentenyl diphosphate isomerase/L-lactate dehydrogenase-like FMN-dependent dehydrogenase
VSGGTTRRLARCHNIDDLRRAAKRRLPYPVFDFLDGGVRRGTDVLKALALGATACMAGRPFLYGLAAGGREGVERAFEILAGEIRRDMMLAGCPTLASLDPGLLRRAD